MNLKIILNLLNVSLLVLATSTNAAVITFNSLWHPDAGVDILDSPYTEAGYVFTNLNTTPNAFGVYGAGSDNYPYKLIPDHQPVDDAALFNRSTNGVTRITKQDGGLFHLESIDLSDLIFDTSGTQEVFTVEFRGLRPGGTEIFQTFTSDDAFGMQTFLLSGFSNLARVDMFQGRPAFQFDNVSVTAVPVPGAVWMFLSGLIGLTGFARIGRR